MDSKTSAGDEKPPGSAVDDEFGRYHRQSLIHWWDQDRLSRAHVLVVGAGALGNEIVKNLVLAGVGHVRIVDLDRVENSNLSRCVFFRGEDEGKPKAEVLAAAASSLNPEIEVTGVVGDVRLECGLGSFIDSDVVIGGLDNREARLYVNQACWKTTTPWIDGAIEGLMGVVRLFIPPISACYECTMNEADHASVDRRRACSLLRREDMLEGKVPTTATSSSVIAGIQVQEAIKLLHQDRVGSPVLAGRGYQFIGLTHDSYLVKYKRDEKCISHETYDLASVNEVSAKCSFRELVQAAGGSIEDEYQVEIEHEIILSSTCRKCAQREETNVLVEAAPAGIAVCAKCGATRQLEINHFIGSDSPVIDMSPSELGIPNDDVVTLHLRGRCVLVRLQNGD